MSQPLAKVVSTEKTHDVDPEVVSVVQGDVYRPEVDTSAVNERKLMWKIDWHTVPWLAFLYFLNSLDRGNIGNAKVSRMLRLSESEFDKWYIVFSCTVSRARCTLRISNTSLL